MKHDSELLFVAFVVLVMIWLIWLLAKTGTGVN